MAQTMSTQSVGPAGATGATGATPTNAPVWTKITKTYAQLSAAALTNDIELYALPAAYCLHAVVIKHSTAFSGGLISAYTASVGIAGNLTKYAAAFSVFQAVAATTLQVTTTAAPDVPNYTASTSIRLAAVSVGANLDAATAGSVSVWLLISQLP